MEPSGRIKYLFISTSFESMLTKSDITVKIQSMIQILLKKKYL